MNEIKIALRQIEESDLGAVQSLSSGFCKIKKFPFGIGRAEGWLQNSRKSSNEVFFIISATKDGGAAYVVGLCGLTKIDWVARHAKIFFAMMDKAKYKGTVQDHPSTILAFSGLLEHGFKKLGLNKLSIEVADSDASLGALEKAGFVVEGVMQDAEFLDGHLRQFIALSLMAAEYEKKCLE